MMCQTCVDNGYLAQSTLDRIEAFNEQWPGLEFGPAHLVLGDDNVEGHHLTFCLDLIGLVQRQRRGDVLTPDEVQRIDVYDTITDEEMEATRLFLLDIQRIPSNER